MEGKAGACPRRRFRYGPNTKWAGDVYEGDYKDDKLHGRGKYT